MLWSRHPSSTTSSVASWAHVGGDHVCAGPPGLKKASFVYYVSAHVFFLARDDIILGVAMQSGSEELMADGHGDTVIPVSLRERLSGARRE